jgi:hypothetical protein
MKDVRNVRWEESVEHAVPAVKDFGQAANDICEKALNDAKEQLHPLIRDVELNRLDKRNEFVQAFKLALEHRIARKLASWQPGVQAVFKFDESWMENRDSWDSSIHLLVKVPRLSNVLRALGKKLDQNLVKYLKQLDWSRFHKLQSVLEIQQVTPNELRHGIGYGAMFCAVYSTPVKVWPQDGRRDEIFRR